MTEKITYQARCHCGSVRFRFTSEKITKGYRCNCSICIRKGIVISAYLSPENIEQVEGMSSVALYQFGDSDVNHYFCGTCGICPFTTVASVPPDYVGAVKPGQYRVNLGCVDNLDIYGLEIEVLDGRSL